MKTEIADKWIAALLSGEYKQTTGKLYDGKGYCCLGVLCKVLGKEFVDEGTLSWTIGSERLRSILPRDVVEDAGMYSSYGCYNSRNSSLTKDNDDGKTFEEIAGIIDEFRDEL